MATSAGGPRDFLGEELETLQLLVELLETERDKLIAAEVEALPEITKEKTSLVTQLNRLATERQAAMQAGIFASDASENTAASAQAWLDSSRSSDCSTLWTELLQLTMRAKELNRVNGLMIGKQLSAGRVKLNVLSAGASGGTLYGANGQARLTPRQGSLVVG